MWSRKQKLCVGLISVLFLVGVTMIFAGRGVFASDRSDAQASFGFCHMQDVSVVQLGEAVTVDPQLLQPGQDDPSDDGLIAYDFSQGWMNLNIKVQADKDVFITVLADCNRDFVFDITEFLALDKPLENLVKIGDDLYQLQFQPRSCLTLPVELRIIVGSRFADAIFDPCQKLIIFSYGEVEDYTLGSQMAVVAHKPQGDEYVSSGSDSNGNGNGNDEDNDDGDSDDGNGGNDKPKPDKDKGNNGVGNGEDPQPPGNPPVNDGPGTGPGDPGNKGGGNNKDKGKG